MPEKITRRAADGRHGTKTEGGFCGKTAEIIKPGKT
jgi:hypothetical protein